MNQQTKGKLTVQLYPILLTNDRKGKIMLRNRLSFEDLVKDILSLIGDVQEETKVSVMRRCMEDALIEIPPPRSYCYVLILMVMTSPA